MSSKNNFSGEHLVTAYSTWCKIALMNCQRENVQNRSQNDEVRATMTPCAARAGSVDMAHPAGNALQERILRRNEAKTQVPPPNRAKNDGTTESKDRIVEQGFRTICRFRSHPLGRLGREERIPDGETTAAESFSERCLYAPTTCTTHLAQREKSDRSSVSESIIAPHQPHNPET